MTCKKELVEYLLMVAFFLFMFLFFDIVWILVRKVPVVCVESSDSWCTLAASSSCAALFSLAGSSSLTRSRSARSIAAKKALRSKSFPGLASTDAACCLGGAAWRSSPEPL